MPGMADARVDEARCVRILALRSADPAARAEGLAAARRTLEGHLKDRPESLHGLFELGRLLAEDLALPYEAVPFLEKARAADPACEAPLRLLLAVYSGRGPPPGPPGEDPAGAAKAWADRTAALEAEAAAGEATRAWERSRRQNTSLDGSDGCP